jgi:hypothetical protein
MLLVTASNITTNFLASELFIYSLFNFVNLHVFSSSFTRHLEPFSVVDTYMVRYSSIEVLVYVVPIIIGSIFYLYQFYKIKNFKYHKYIAIAILALFGIMLYLLKQVANELSISSASLPYRLQFGGHEVSFDYFFKYYLITIVILLAFWYLIYLIHKLLDKLLTNARSVR